MITRAKFQNFKALRDVEITFDSRLTVLVGPNGSGKTSVLQGINALCSVGQPPQLGVRPFNVMELVPSVTAGMRPEDLSLEVAASVPSGEVGLSILATARLAPDVRRGTETPLSWQIRFPPNGKQGSVVNGVAPPEVAGAIGPAALLRLDTTKLAAPSQPNGVPPTVQHDGTGLASTLAYQLLNQPERFEEIVTAFKRVIRPVERLRFDKVQDPQRGGFADVILFDYRGARGVRAEHASTGTLLTLGLLAVILGPRQPQVVLLDDLDHGLHPKAQMELIEVLRTLLNQYSDLQIIASSHSPYILNQLEWNEVRVTGLRDDGSASCHKLEEHPEVEKWREAMTPGEFWSHIGEDWVKKLDKAQPAAVAP